MQNSALNNNPAMAMDLHDILSGIGVGLAHDHCHYLIYIGIIGVNESSMIQTMGGHKLNVAGRVKK
jgi:hypothetical protein